MNMKDVEREQDRRMACLRVSWWRTLWFERFVFAVINVSVGVVIGKCL